MDMSRQPFRASLEEYRKQAEDLLALSDSDSEVRSVPLDLSDAQLTVARWHDFKDWPQLAESVEAVAGDDSPVTRFESAVKPLSTATFPRIRGSCWGHRLKSAPAVGWVRGRS
jgi:hypothetical protein